MSLLARLAKSLIPPAPSSLPRTSLSVRTYSMLTPPSHSTPPTPALLHSLASNPALPPHTWYLLASAVATTLGLSPTWIPAIYFHAVSALGPAPSEPSPAPEAFTDDPLPRRRVVRRMKEALVKGAILHGVPHAIQASFALKEAVLPGDRDASFVRAGVADELDDFDRGHRALHRIYRDKMPLVGEIKDAMRDVEWFSYYVTYGIFLAPISEEDHRAPLSILDTEIVTLGCLLAQKAEKEVMWHLRGSLWLGMTEEQVEAVQCAIEEVASVCGVDVKEGMPRVKDIVDEMALQEKKAAIS